MGTDHFAEPQIRHLTGDCVDLSVFGVSGSCLKRALENALHGNQVHDVSISVDTCVPRRYYGARGHKIILTYSYTRAGGRSEKARLFVKRHSHPGSTEGWHYQHLSEHGAPIPRLHLSV